MIQKPPSPWRGRYRENGTMWPTTQLTAPQLLQKLMAWGTGGNTLQTSSRQRGMMGHPLR